MQATQSYSTKLMRLRTLAIALSVACLQFCLPSAHATHIDISLGDSPNVTSGVETSFNDLNGALLHGQTLSLDFFFLNQKFVRLFSITNSLFDAQITLHTSGWGQVGFLSGTGFLIDKHGDPLAAPQDLGSASGGGSMAAGLFPLFGTGLHRPLDFFGVHLDLILPDNPLVAITSSGFSLSSDSDAPFGVGPGVPRDIVPDEGSTVLFLSLALLALILPQLRLRVG
jgi:hypothetical protein